MRAHTPVRRLVSRHTRELLRGYYRKGLLATPIADRRVEDRFVEMTPAERDLHDEVRSYISTTYPQAAAAERTAVGFVMTVYGRRLASSFYALGATLRRHRDAIASDSVLTGSEEDAPDDTAADEVLEADEVAALERAALAAEEQRCDRAPARPHRATAAGQQAGPLAAARSASCVRTASVR